MAETLPNVAVGLRGFVPLDLIAAVAGDEAVGRADLGVLVKLLDPVVCPHLVAAEQPPLVIAPEVAADPLVHLNRAERAAPLKTVARLVGVDLLPETVRPA